MGRRSRTLQWDIIEQRNVWDLCVLTGFDGSAAICEVDDAHCH